MQQGGILIVANYEEYCYNILAKRESMQKG
jgi:hypothetical protein